MSYAKENEEEVPVPPKDPNQKSIFEYLKKIVDAINAKEAQTAHHLDRIATALEKTVNKPSSMGVSSSTPKPPATPVTKAVSKPTSAPSSFLDEVKSAFSTDLQELLKFEDMGGWIRVAPRRFLGSDNFAKIASVIRSLGGEYISAGKDSHFKVTKK